MAGRRRTAGLHGRGPRLRAAAVLAVTGILAAAALLLFGRDRDHRSPLPGLETAAKHDPLVAALQQLSRDSRTQVAFRFEDGFPQALHFLLPVDGDSAPARARAYLDRYPDLYRLGREGFALNLRRVQPQRGGEVAVFYQTYRGLEVFGAELAVYTAGPLVLATVGALLSEDPLLNLDAGLPRAQAVEIAFDLAGRPAGRLLGQPRLIVFDPALLGPAPPQPKLAWRVAVRGSSAIEAIVDANTGAVLLSAPLARSDTFDDYDLDLEDAENDANAQDDDCYWTSDETEVGDADGIIEDYQGSDVKSQDAGEIWWHVRNTYKFFKEEHRRTGWDDDGGEHDVYIRATVPNASFSECVLIQFKQQYITFNTVVHEFTHGVIHFSSSLNNGIESQSVNESMADIMAAVAEGNWIHGEDHLATFNPPIRNLADPPALGDPDQYSEIGDEEHENGGITNKAAFLISEGGTHPGTLVQVNGIGMEKTGELFYDVLTSLPSSAPLAIVRDVAVAEVNQRLAFNKLLKENPQFLGQWGPGPNDWVDADLCSVRNGFKAVELGQGDLDCDGNDDAIDNDDDSDLIPDNVDTCPKSWSANNQADTDGDGAGDLCDDDDDDDGVADDHDNCPLDKNASQSDSDNNGIGDECQDSDGDGWKDKVDNCDNAWNPGQEDLDKDGGGNLCDPDDDNDNVLDDVDNCPATKNSDQANADGDQHGDACDNCKDDYENPKSILPPNSDKDGDGLGDICDPNPDGAGLIDLGGLLPLLEGIARADGGRYDLRVAATPGASITLPLPLCAIKPCEDAPPPSQCFSLWLDGLEGQVAALIRDDTGAGRARLDASEDEGRALRFRPIGGREYQVTLYFLPRFDGEAVIGFQPSLCQAGMPAASAVAPGPAAQAVPADAGSTPAASAVAGAPPRATATPTPRRSTPAPSRTAAAGATSSPTRTAPAGLVATATSRPGAPVATTTPPPPLLPTPTPSPRPTLTPTPTATPRATFTPSPTATRRVPFTPTPSPTPRVTPPPR